MLLVEHVTAAPAIDVGTTCGRIGTVTFRSIERIAATRTPGTDIDRGSIFVSWVVLVERHDAPFYTKDRVVWYLIRMDRSIRREMLVIIERVVDGPSGDSAKKDEWADWADALRAVKGILEPIRKLNDRSLESKLDDLLSKISAKHDALHAEVWGKAPASATGLKGALNRLKPGHF